MLFSDIFQLFGNLQLGLGNFQGMFGFMQTFFQKALLMFALC
jgi:hypothetical protein